MSFIGGSDRPCGPGSSLFVAIRNKSNGPINPINSNTMEAGLHQTPTYQSCEERELLVGDSYEKPSRHVPRRPQRGCDPTKKNDDMVYDDSVFGRIQQFVDPYIAKEHKLRRLQLGVGAVFLFCLFVAICMIATSEKRLIRKPRFDSNNCPTSAIKCPRGRVPVVPR